MTAIHRNGQGKLPFSDAINPVTSAIQRLERNHHALFTVCYLTLATINNDETLDFLHLNEITLFPPGEQGLSDGIAPLARTGKTLM